jgi:GT2 family glycosyltransferase
MENGELRMDKVAIVILNWNGAKMLHQYLPTVLNYSRDEATVYVADNASTDDSLALLRREFPECKTIVLDRNWGFAEGYNKALAQIEATYYLLLNSDIEVTHHWLTPLIEFMDTHAEVAACQPKLLSIYDRDSFEYAGASGGFLDRYGYPFCRGRIFETVERDNGQYDYRQEILWATGAALMIRSKDYWEVGGLDGRFFAHNEEIDLCWRLRIRGRKLYCLPESYVYHVGGGTLPKSNPMKTFLNFRNNLTMLYKCLPDSELAHVMRVRWFLDYLAAWEMLLLKRNWGDFVAIFKARHAFARWKKDFAADRQTIQQGRVAQQIPEQRMFSLLWEYYAKGHKKYSDF